MSSRGMRVGDLARRAGLTVRTLHHYDAIGLLRPSLHTDAGHRLYTDADLARLQQVLSLRQLGFSLEQVRDCLDRPGFSPLKVIEMHLERLRRQIAVQQQLSTHLEALARLLRGSGEASAEQFLKTIEVITMVESYYTPEQLEYLKRRREEVGEEAIEAAQREWPELISKLKTHMEAGTDPSDPRVQTLGQRCRELIQSFTGGDPGIAASLNRLWKEQGSNLAQQHGMDYDPKLFEYMGRVHAAAGDTTC